MYYYVIYKAYLTILFSFTSHLNAWLANDAEIRFSLFVCLYVTALNKHINKGMKITHGDVPLGRLNAQEKQNA